MAVRRLSAPSAVPLGLVLETLQIPEEYAEGVPQLVGDGFGDVLDVFGLLFETEALFFEFGDVGENDRVPDRLGTDRDRFPADPVGVGLRFEM